MRTTTRNLYKIGFVSSHFLAPEHSPFWFLRNSDFTSVSVCMSTAPLLPFFDIASTRTTAAKTKLDEDGENGEAGGDPHEDEHLDPNLGLDIQFCHTFSGHFQNNEDGGCENCCDGGAESGEEGERSDGEVGPAGVDGEGGEEDHDEVCTGACKEETEHPLGSDFQDSENSCDLGRKSNCL